MKILLTGHRGFIGQNMLNRLNKKDSFFVDTFEWNDPLPKVNQYDWIMHLGAISSTTETDIDKVMTQNYDFSVWLFNECVKHKVKLQYSSSASVYGKQSSFREDSSLSPASPYAWSKYLFDRYVNQNINAIDIVQGFRYFNVYGPHEDHKGNQSSPHHKFLIQYKTNGHIKVFEGSSNYKRDFVHVNRVVDTHIEFLKVDESGIWNVGTARPQSFLDIARSITDNIIEVPFPEELKGQYQEFTCADMSKMNHTIKKYKLNIGD